MFKPLNLLKSLCLVTLLQPSAVYAELPTLGDPTQQELTPFREYLMGKNFYRTLKANVPFVTDLEVNDYINSLGKKLVSHSDNPDKEFRFFVIKVDNINAFAGPDAYIGFHTGLITAAKNESELAGVMAHEISHVTQRHLARAMTESSTSPATMFATILAGILLASQNPEAGAALIYGGQAAMVQSQINFTRANEYEADRIGIGVLRNSGINPEGMAGFFETLLAKSESDNIFSQMEYLRTHPLNITRIAESRNRINKEDGRLPDDSLNFQFVRSRVLVETSQSHNQIIKHILGLDKHQQNIVTHYTLGLAYLADHQADKSIRTLQTLSKTSSHPWIQLALADAYIASQNRKAALDILENLNTLYPNYLPVSIRYARLLIDMKQSQQAINILNAQLKTQKKPVVYRTLARAYFSNSQVELALEATSYEYEKEGYLKLAVQQITNALQQPGVKTLTQQRLESRKNELTQQISRENME